MTGGHDLPARWVIHTVGPIWHGGRGREDELLASCYRSSLALARERGVRSIAFPSISTGAYGFPADRAARIATREVALFLATSELPESATFVCFGASALQIMQAALGDLAAARTS